MESFKAFFSKLVELWNKIVPLRLLLVIALIYLLILFVHFLIDIYSSQDQNTIDSWNNLLNSFNTPITIGVFIIAIITLIFTIARIKQTDNTIDLIKDNNQFNNFYKHKELFKNYMLRTDSYWIILRNLNIHEDVVINKLYKQFYYKTYKLFRPAMNQKTKDYVLNLSNKIKKYRTVDLMGLIEQISTGQLNLNIPVYRFELEDIVGKIYSNLNHELMNRQQSRPFAYGYSSQIFSSALHCYIKFELYEDILGFDGEVEILDSLVKSNFKKAINHYIKSLTLDNQLRLQK